MWIYCWMSEGNINRDTYVLQDAFSLRSRTLNSFHAESRRVRIQLVDRALPRPHTVFTSAAREQSDSHENVGHRREGRFRRRPVSHFRWCNPLSFLRGLQRGDQAWRNRVRDE